MNASRRTFLAAAVAGAAGMVLDPERLLWVPGRKTIFLPLQRTVIASGIVDPSTLDPRWAAAMAFKVEIHQVVSATGDPHLEAVWTQIANQVLGDLR